jgi:hypothetical protein
VANRFASRVDKSTEECQAVARRNQDLERATETVRHFVLVLPYDHSGERLLLRFSVLVLDSWKNLFLKCSPLLHLFVVVSGLFQLHNEVLNSKLGVILSMGESASLSTDPPNRLDFLPFKRQGTRLAFLCLFEPLLCLDAFHDMVKVIV